mmetsp:Transcript_29956/g.82232  ORF Transcript_29956/g.82232 Transcript_29956/m.82232 type:complete len:226 (+) Transcript_29956:275-952(+)
MVDVPSLGVQAAATTTFNERIVGHLDEDELVHRDACIDHSLGLVWRPGKAVEQTPLFCDVGLRQAVLHEVNNELAWNEFACGHVFLCLFAQLSALFDVGAQDVAGGNVNVAEFLLDALALRSLARSRRACDDNERAVRATLRHACQTHCPANANSCLAAPTSHDRGSNGSAEEYYASESRRVRAPGLPTPNFLKLWRRFRSYDVSRVRAGGATESWRHEATRECR